MLPEYVILLPLPISIFFTFRYIYFAYIGKIQPNIVTWSVWAAASLLSFYAALSSGSGFLQIFTTFTSGFFPLLTVLVLIIAQKGKVSFTKFDIFSLIIAICGLVVWKVFDDPSYVVIAFLAGLFADMAGFMPTIIKTFKMPKSEDPIIYLIGICNAILQLLIIQDYSIFKLGFPVYVICFNGLIVGIILKYKISRL